MMRSILTISASDSGSFPQRRLSRPVGGLRLPADRLRPHAWTVAPALPLARDTLRPPQRASSPTSDPGARRMCRPGPRNPRAGQSQALVAVTGAVVGHDAVTLGCESWVRHHRTRNDAQVEIEHPIILRFESGLRRRSYRVCRHRGITSFPFVGGLVPPGPTTRRPGTLV